VKYFEQLDKKEKPTSQTWNGRDEGFIKDLPMNIALRDILINSDDLAGTTKTLLFALFTYLHGEKTECWPSVGDISKVSGLSRRTIQRHLRILEQLEYILVLPQNDRKSNLYKMICIDSVQRNLRQDDAQSIPPKGGLKEHVQDVDLALTLQKNPSDAIVQSNPPVTDDEPVMARWKKAMETVAAREAEEEAKKETNKTPQPMPRPARIESGSSNSNQKKEEQTKKLVFKGDFQNYQKLVEIWNVFTANNWIKNSENEFINYLCTYSAIARKAKLPDNNRKKIRNFYAYLVWIFKENLSRQIIRRKDDNTAQIVKKELFRLGLYPQF